MKRFRLYAVIAIFLVCITAAVSCIIIASEKARQISLGEEYAVVMFEGFGQK
ncbi:MAG: hypothetical protein J6A60_08415 [Clostridia bacterium]|nr:hypothetical protein [Clostridia bacterium]